MGVVIESSIWEPGSATYLFLFVASICSIFLFPNLSNGSSNKSSNPFEHGISLSFLRFQRSFLFIYSLASVIEGLLSVFGEYEFAHYGASKEQMVLALCVRYAAALLLGPLLGMLADVKGQKITCIIFCILHLFVALWKRFTVHPGVLVASICLSAASSIFSFSFETWMVLQHEKKGHRQDTLSDTLWLMFYFESASLVGSQALANWLVGSSVEKNIASPSTAAVLLTLIVIIYVTKGWTETPRMKKLKEYSASFYAYVSGDKRIWLLASAQACLNFSIAIFWILWAPTVVADGREVCLGLIYPCLMGARMVGSTAFPWLVCGPSSCRTEDCLAYAFVVAGAALSIVAYDYQEIGTLVTLFCLFHACVGLILPSLARLRTLLFPNEFRGGMMALSLAPANAATLFFLIQRGYYQNIGNSVMMAFAALGLFTAAGCMHLLRRWGKQPYQNWHKL